MKATERRGDKKRETENNKILLFLSASVRQFPCLSISLCLPFILAGCAGTSPLTTSEISPNRGAIVIAARINTPNGRAYSGGVHLTFQGIGGGSLETYQFFLPARKTLFYQIATGIYRVEAPKNFFGIPEKTLTVIADGKKYFPPFPKELSQLKPLVVKPERTIALGELDISVTPSTSESPRAVSIKFHHGTKAQRRVLSRIIRDMLNPDTPENVRKSEQSWLYSLQKALTDANQQTEIPNPKP